MIEIKIGKAGSPHPGFGHIVMALLGFIHHAQLSNKKIALNDSEWVYGKWRDYFQNSYFYPAYEPNEVTEVFDCTDKNIKWGLLYWELYINNDPEFYLKYLAKLLEFNAETASFVKDKKATIADRNICLATHFRLGDKSKQNGLDNNAILAAFEQKLAIYPSVKTVFFMGDEYDSLRSLINKYREQFDILTLCPDTYDGKPGMRSRDNLLLLLTEMEIASLANVFIGSYSAVTLLIYSLRKLAGRNTHSIMGNGHPFYDFMAKDMA